jgi:hypothetical protein
MKRLVVASLVGLALGVTGVVEAAMVCEVKHSGVMVLRDGPCKKREIPVDLQTLLNLHNGAPGSQGIQGNPGPQGVPGQNAVSLFAAISSSGTVLEGNATGAAHVGTGSYTVDFAGHDFTHCIANVTPGWPVNPGSNTLYYAAHASAQMSQPIGGGRVVVSIWYNQNPGDVQTDSGFLLSVNCPVP